MLSASVDIGEQLAEWLFIIPELAALDLEFLFAQQREVGLLDPPRLDQRPARGRFDLPERPVEDRQRLVGGGPFSWRGFDLAAA